MTGILWVSISASVTALVMSAVVIYRQRQRARALRRFEFLLRKAELSDEGVDFPFHSITVVSLGA